MPKRKTKVQLATEIAALKEKHEVERTAWENEKKGLEAQIDVLRAADEEKQNQLNKRELTKLAQAYGDQESKFRSAGITWLGIFSLLTGLIFYVAVGFADILNTYTWDVRLNYILPSAVAVTFWIFSGRQYGYFRKLETDFANRKALAQSYHNLLSASEQEQEIRGEFFKQVSLVLCSPVDSSIDTSTLFEKSVDALSDAVKALSKN